MKNMIIRYKFVVVKSIKKKKEITWAIDAQGKKVIQIEANLDDFTK